MTIILVKGLFRVNSRYIEYYLRTINTHQHGLKLVSGGTGLGKTSAIPHVVQLLPEGQKAIYVANRIQLLEEVKKDAGDISVLLPRDIHVLESVLSKHKDELDRLISTFARLSLGRKEEISHLKQNLASLKELLPIRALYGFQLKSAEQITSKVMFTLRNLLLEMKQKAPTEHEYWMQNRLIWDVFPYIEFRRNPQKKLLLITLQKAFYGFFDGDKQSTAIDLKGYIIFADEFDFLERDLTELIAKSTQIDDPFRFVELFYQEISRHKIQLEQYPVSASDDTRDEIKDILQQVERLQHNDIPYPNINQFTSDPNTDVTIFRTSHLIQSKPIRLCQTERSFHLVGGLGACNTHSIHVPRLFNTVSRVSERILRLLKRLEIQDLTTYRGIIYDVYRGTVFQEQIRQISSIPKKKKQQYTKFGELLSSGFYVYDIYDMDNATDPEEVDVKHYATYISPEKFIAQLAQKNCVFGLSATADIPRCINNFNFAWMSDNDGGGINLIPLDSIDEEIIQSETIKKAGMRSNMLNIQRLPQIGDDDLAQFVEETLALDGDRDNRYRKLRVINFFTSLQWITQHPQTQDGEVASHLIFVSSFRQIIRFFENESLRQNYFYQIEEFPEVNIPEPVYKMTMHNNPFLVLFYDAKKAEKIREIEDVFSNLFLYGMPVVLITQYQSAGNGVNLTYQIDGQKRDFINIHLIDLPYYYFSTPSADDIPEDKTTHLKKNLWYLSKLYYAQYLNESEFKAKLRTLHHPAKWHQDYISHKRMRDDYYFNSLSTLIQALGRVERVWSKMPNQTVLLTNDTYAIFARLVTEFRWLVDKRAKVNSDNLNKLIKLIESHVEHDNYQIDRVRDRGLSYVNQISRENIQDLLNQFSWVRKNEDNNSIRATWEKWRELALKHEFADDRLADFIYTSPYIENGIVCTDDHNSIIPQNLAHSSQSYDLDMIYRIIRSNSTIYKHFQHEGYQLGFDKSSQTIFTPAFYQAILKGAIGEEAIFALFKSERIHLQPMENHVFEIADFQVQDKPYFIDSKYYSDDTLERYLLSPEDDGFHYKLNEAFFVNDKIKKWRKLASIYGESTKLIVINLDVDDERPKGYYQIGQDNITQVNAFDDAQIINIQGALRTTEPNQYQDAFIRLLDDMKKSGG